MNRVVVAGAGTGKTYTLVQAYMDALLGSTASTPIHPARLLAVTFTDKAGAEMRHRITQAVLESQRDPVLMRKIVRSLPNAPIVTFHGFCSRLLRTYASEIGMNAEFELLSPVDERALLSDVAESIILDRMTSGDPAISELVARFQLRRRFGAKGLVDTVVSIFGELRESGLAAEELSIEAATRNMQDTDIRDAKQQIQNFNQHPKLSTDAKSRGLDIERAFHQFVLHINEDEVALAHFYAELAQLLKGRFGPDDARKSMVAAITQIAGAVCDRVVVGNAACVASLVGELSRQWLLRIRESGQLGFGDLLVLAHQLLRDNLEVRERVKKRFDKIFVDEFQDTSRIQEDIVALLGEYPSRSLAIAHGQRAMGSLELEPGRLFIVGDPKQSIYGFRGADARLFQHTLQVLTAGDSPTGVRENLQQSRRSQSELVRLVNAIAQETLVCGEDGVPFEASDQLLPMRESLRDAGAIWRIQIKDDTETTPQVAQVVAEQIQLMSAEARDIAVLVRRVATATPIVKALQARGIPAILLGGEGYYAQQEVNDVISLFKLLTDPLHPLATLTVLRSPFIAMSLEHMSQLIEANPEWSGGLTWMDVVAHAGATEVPSAIQESVRHLERFLVGLRGQLAGVGIDALVIALLRDERLLVAFGAYANAEQALRNIIKMGALPFRADMDTAARVNRLWELSEQRPKESIAFAEQDSNAVSVMTIHQAKGLEFPIVVLADTWTADPPETDDVLFDLDMGLAAHHRGRPITVLADGPVSIDRVRKRKQQRSEAELARVLYVALTRARDRVFFVDAQKAGKRVGGHGASLCKLFMAAYEKHGDQLGTVMPVVELGAAISASEPGKTSDSAVQVPRVFFNTPCP